MTYIRDSKLTIYVSTEVHRWLRLIAKSESLPEEGQMTTADAIADQILRQAIREQHPQLAEHQKAIDAAEKKLVDDLRRARQPTSTINVGTIDARKLKLLLLLALLALSLVASMPAKATDYSWSIGVKPTLFIHVQFPDIATAYTHEEAVSTMGNVNQRFRNMSYGQTSLAVTVTNQVYTLPHPSTYYGDASFCSGCGDDALNTDAVALASNDYVVSNYDRLVVSFPHAGGSGLAGGQSFSRWIQLGQKWIPIATINSNLLSSGVITHEMGHGYGLAHSALWKVTDGNPISPYGTRQERGDNYSPMGANYTATDPVDIPPSMKNQLGWILDSRVKIITATGTYRVRRFDTLTPSLPGSGTNNLALKIVRSSSEVPINSIYWIGVRRAWTSNSYMMHGAYVTLEVPTQNGNYSYLLDFNTPGVNIEDSPLAINQTFLDADSGILIKPVAEGGIAPNQWMDIYVQIQ